MDEIRLSHSIHAGRIRLIHTQQEIKFWVMQKPIAIKLKLIFNWTLLIHRSLDVSKEINYSLPLIYI